MQIHLVIYIYMCVCTRIYIYIPATKSTTCPNIKNHCVLWDKMHMSVIMAFILQRTAQQPVR